MDSSAYHLLLVPAFQGIALGLGFGLLIHFALEAIAACLETAAPPRKPAADSEPGFGPTSGPGGSRSTTAPQTPDRLARAIVTRP